MDESRIAAQQLGRMRGMTRYYHARFFSDVRFTTVAALVLLVVGWWEVPEAFLLVPVVALLGANATAFDASYLILARQYAARLERFLNDATDSNVLVAAELEDRYLFPLDEPKVVTFRFGSVFTWFGWMTLLYTVTGAVVFLFGLGLGWSVLEAAGTGWTVFYMTVLVGLTAGSLGVGSWWFVAGVGEARLRAVLDERFPDPEIG